VNLLLQCQRKWFEVLLQTSINSGTNTICRTHFVYFILYPPANFVVLYLKNKGGGYTTRYQCALEYIKCVHNFQMRYVSPKSEYRDDLVTDIPVTGLGGPQGCQTSRLPHFPDNRLTVGAEVVSLTRLPPESATGSQCGWKHQAHRKI
jgi:hypothetical protein